jgi:hypothetical protein
MRYWITTHWPPRIDEPEDDTTSGVYLPEGRHQAGQNLSVGDYVFIYQSISGRTEIRQLPDGSTKRVPCQWGKGGLILYGEVTEDLSAIPNSQPEVYSDGSTIWWRWYAPLSILSRTGFLERKKVAITLGYSPNYNFHGFGTLHSGLLEISESVFQDLADQYHEQQPVSLPSFNIPHAGGTQGGGGESDAHRFLKEYVVAEPVAAMGEKGLKTLRAEYPFPTGDRADIVLTDIHNRVVAVEVETSVAKTDVVGPLQAIKYRFMLEWITSRSLGDSRAVLIAYSIHNEIKKLCKKYRVEYIEISKNEVDKWRATNFV